MVCENAEMNAPSKTPRWQAVWRFFGGALAIWLAALAPILVATMLIEQPWTHTEPPWSWLLVPPLPLIGLTMALSRPSEQAWRALAAIGAATAIVAFSMLCLGIWPAVAVVLLAIALMTLCATAPAAFTSRSPRVFGRALLAWTGCVLGFGIVAAFAEEFVIARKAEAYANGRAYCIEYASQKDAFGYEPVTNLFDLNGVKMRARLTAGGSTMFRFQNHALIMVEADEGRKEWRSWSYTEQAFVVGYGEVKTACAPAPHYVENLPIW